MTDHHGEPIPPRQPFQAAPAWLKRKRHPLPEPDALARQLLDDLGTIDRIEAWLREVRAGVERGR